MNVPPQQPNLGQPPVKKPVPVWLWVIVGTFSCCCLFPIFNAILSTASGNSQISDEQSFPERSVGPNPTSSSQETGNPTIPEAVEKKPDLEVLEYESKTEEFARYVIGKIRNNTKKSYSYVQVEINLLDAEGNVVGSTIDNVNNLDPGSTWSFKAMIFEEEAERFEIKDVSGF